jgi:hypothetical protein
VLSDDQIADIEIFCAQIWDGLENATFEQKRHIIDLLDVRGTLAIENDEKVIYVKCLIGQQLLSVARISPWRSTVNRQQLFVLTAKLVLRKTREWGNLELALM